MFRSASLVRFVLGLGSVCIALTGPVSADAPPASPSLPRPAYAPAESLPIDLPTVLRMVDANSPIVGYAQARVRETQARQQRAEVQWIPTLAYGLTYNRFDGQTQNQRGEVFGVSRSNLFAGGGVSLRVDLADAFFDRLVARRLSAAESANAQNTVLNAQLEAALAYVDLVEAHGRLAVNADSLSRAETMLKFARNAQEAGISKTAADANRAATEVYIRRRERSDLIGRAGAASARLARLLLLDPTVELRPADVVVAPLVLVNAACTLEDLLRAAASRPDLAASASRVAAAGEQMRKAKAGPILPRVIVEQQVGGFGGGINAHLGNFEARNALGASVYWELNNLGFGDAALIREARASYEQTLYRLADVQARASAEVVEAAKNAAAQYDSMDSAERAVAEAVEMYRKLQESSFNMPGPRAQYDPLEPLIAIQQLNQARLQYLSAVVDFNRAQLRLYTALGCPVDRSQGASPAPPAPTPPDRSTTGAAPSPSQPVPK